MKHKPIFLRAIPRSGGTLLATLFDAHQDIAMSYEIYENYLSDKHGNPLEPQQILGWFEHIVSNSKDDVQWIKQLPDNNLRVFLFRARRGGLSVIEILEILKNFVGTGNSFETSAGRLYFIEALMQKKAQNYGKSVWGGKTQADLYKLHDRHPDACFFIMRRDPRDMYASMKNKGSFRYTATEAATLWKERILEFRKFVRRRNPKAMEICYEELVTRPVAVLTEICRLTDVEYNPAMLDYHKQNLTLFQNPHGHLSNDQLQKGLNTQSIDRWKRDLNSDEVESVIAVARDLICEKQ
jgi:hypothetical protein